MGHWDKSYGQKGNKGGKKYFAITKTLLPCMRKQDLIFLNTKELIETLLSSTLVIKYFAFSKSETKKKYLYKITEEPKRNFFLSL